MAGNQSLTQELKLTQRLTPLQLQLVPLLQMNALQIEEEVRKELEENPALVVDENANSDQYNNTDEDGDFLCERCRKLLL